MASVSPVVRTLEDLFVVGASAFSTWQATKDPNQVALVATSAPFVRSGLALLLTKKQSSGLIEAFKIVWAAIGQVQAQSNQTTVQVVPNDGSVPAS